MEFPNFEAFHPERLDHAVTADCLLKDLTEIGKAGAALFSRAANFAS